MIVEGLEVEWLGHDGFLVKAEGKVICFDPFEASHKAKEKADFIFISHDHHDHLSEKDIKAFSKPSTSVIAAECCRGKLREAHFVGQNRTAEIAGLKVQTIPAYNTNKFRSASQPYHPKDYGGVGFIVEFGGKRVYHAGDTDFVPEMGKAKGVDIAFIPVSGTYVMTPEEAAEAANLIGAKVAIPMHYGKIVGSKSDAEKFKALYAGKAIIMG